MITLSWFLLSATGLLAVVALYMHIRARCLRRAGSYQHEFFDVASNLARDPNFPPEGLDSLKIWARRLGDRSSIWMLVVALSRTTKEMRSGLDVAAGHPFHLSERLEEQWASMFYYWCMALTYRRPIIGLMVRVQLFALLDPRIRSRTERRLLDGISHAST